MPVINCMHCGQNFDTGASYRDTPRLSPVKCGHCKNQMLILTSGGYVIETRPYLSFEIKLDSSKLPKEVLADFNEAIDC